MTVMDGQMDIFGAVEGGEAPVILDADGGWTCPECGTYWDTVRDPAGNRDWHLYGIAGKYTYPHTLGRCRTQDLYLDWLHTRRDKSLRKSVKWEGADLLALIIECRLKGCTDVEVRDALAIEWDQS